MMCAWLLVLVRSLTPVQHHTERGLRVPAGLQVLRERSGCSGCCDGHFVTTATVALSGYARISVPVYRATQRVSNAVFMRISPPA